MNVLATSRAIGVMRNAIIYMKRTYWTAYCDKDRISAMNEISTFINQYGFITDFRMFSDLSVSFIIEVEERHVDDLYKTLESYMSLDAVAPLNSQSLNERAVLLNVTFSKGTGNLRIEIPAVSG